MNVDSYQAIALSLGAGLLVGLQREWKDTEIAGIRTFPLITLLGTLTTLVGGGEPYWLSAAGLVAIVGVLCISNLMKIKSGSIDLGMTTEVAAALMFVVGAALGIGLTGPALVTTGIVAVLLHWKQPLHSFVDRIEPRDIKGLINLVLIALVILPMLPNETFGPYDVLNPYKIWRMVVLIAGISMAAYIAYRLLGAETGAILGGLLGGLISSTATTVSYARQTKSNGSGTAMAALVILLASTVVNIRVLFEIGVVAPQLLKTAVPPMGILLVLMTIESIVIYLPLRKEKTTLPHQGDPAQLKPAIFFAALYAVVLFVVAAVKEHMGTEALYGVAAISGLTDVDAMTLSTARLFQEGRVEASTAWRVIVLATLSNLVFKAGAVAVLGSRRLTVYVVITFGIALLCGAALLYFWPDFQVTIPAEMLNSKA